MYTIGDAVREHAKKASMGQGGTTEGLEFLELPNSPEFYTAANIYQAALSIINKLQDKVNQLQGHE